MKKVMALILSFALIFSFGGCSLGQSKGTASSSSKNVALQTSGSSTANSSIPERVKNLLSQMTLEEKAAQMVQGEHDVVTAPLLKQYQLGSILSGGGNNLDKNSGASSWADLIDEYQKASLSTRLKIPVLYGMDAVHGHSRVYGAVVFPQNIGLGAANDKDLMYKMGCAVAEEMKLTKILWNFSPCVAVAQDPRWGRVYESISSDPAIVTSLSAEYTKGQLEHGVMPTAKHYLADGGTEYTSNGKYLVDRGDAKMSDQEMRSLYLEPYKAQIKAGVRIIMASFSSYNGVKMTENKQLLTDVLKNELKFSGIVVSDWEAAHELSGSSFEKNIVIAVNAGIDMFMEPYQYADTINAIVDNTKKNEISVERVNDAVTRILTVKMELGLFDDPYQKNIKHEVTELGSQQYRDLAKQLVEKSLVLLKNKGNVLPLKKNQKVFVTGPALNNIGVQCGGWTFGWQGNLDKDGEKSVPGTTILEGLQQYAKQYNLTIITDPAKANQADVTVIAVGEKPYAEYEGDSADISLTGKMALTGNADAIKLAKQLGKPTVALIVAGRQVIIKDYLSEWDAVVMCYLPGSEGAGVASNLVGETKFTGKLPMPWYQNCSDIKKSNANLQFKLGYGLTD